MRLLTAFVRFVLTHVSTFELRIRFRQERKRTRG
jgi:hypothetical protein